jgi:hypothetical protein
MFIPSRLGLAEEMPVSGFQPSAQRREDWKIRELRRRLPRTKNPVPRLAARWNVCLAAPGGGAAFFCSVAERNSFTRVAETEVTISPPAYKPPPRRAYTDLGWLCAALIGPATFLAVWIYCAVTYGFLLGFLLGWIPALILALLVAVVTIFLWPLLAVASICDLQRLWDSSEIAEYRGVHWHHSLSPLVVARGSAR